MSRLGKLPITIPSGVKLNVQGNIVSVEGPKGKLSRPFPARIKIEVKENTAIVIRPDDEQESRAQHGLVRSILNSMVVGASTGFTKTLVAIGVGYRMQVQGNKVNLNLGFSHPIVYELPQGVTAKAGSQTELTIECADKEVLGRVCDEIRRFRPPEPYKGKGIRYQGEQIAMKAGKAAGGGK